MENPNKISLVQITSDIVGSFVAHNTLRAAKMPALIAAVHGALQNIIAPKPDAEPVSELKPAVSVKKSITEAYLICLDDGRKFQSMKRHLAGLGMTLTTIAPDGACRGTTPWSRRATRPSDRRSHGHPGWEAVDA